MWKKEKRFLRCGFNFGAPDAIRSALAEKFDAR